MAEDYLKNADAIHEGLWVDDDKEKWVKICRALKEAGLGRFDLDEMRRAFRRDKLIPRSLAGEMNKMAPEYSEPEYSMTGSYQPEVAYGL